MLSGMPDCVRTRLGGPANSIKDHREENKVALSVVAASEYRYLPVIRGRRQGRQLHHIEKELTMSLGDKVQGPLPS